MTNGNNEMSHAERVAGIRESLGIAESPYGATAGFLASYGEPGVGADWFRGVSGGVPETKQEEAYILDYINRYGYAPTPEEVGGYRGRLDRTQFQYTPESTMGRMGFETFEEYLAAQKEAEPYGPHPGELVPYGGVVALDEQGRPVMRYMEGERVPLEYLKTGRFQLPEQRPTAEELLGEYSFEDRYKAGLIDYLEQAIQRDAPFVKGIELKYKEELDKLNYNLDRGLIKETEYRDRLLEADRAYREELSNLMYTNKANDIATRAMYQLNQGYTENLPFAGEIQQMGIGTPSLQAMAGAKMQPEWTGYPRGEYPEYPTGKENAEFNMFVQGLNLAPQYRDWLGSQYNIFLNLWRQSGMRESFVEWLRRYLAGGA